MAAEERLAAVADLAAGWRDPEFEPRAEAVRVALEAGGRYTEEGLAFALNHRMHQFTPQQLRSWLGADLELAVRRRVVISSFGGAPLGGLEEAVAVLLVGHEPVLDRDSLTPVAVRFAEAVASASGVPCEVLPRVEALASASAWVADVPEGEVEERGEEAVEAGIPEPDRLFRVLGTAVAVVGGNESDEVWSGLAEDLLLHDGRSESSPRIVWVPAAAAPDALLNALAGLRELIPAHPETDGALSLPAAFLAASDTPRARGSGFLVSLGEPEPQGPSHIRWTEYGDLEAVRAWLAEQGDTVHLVVAPPSMAETLGRPVVAPGDAHRPGLRPDLVGWLRALALTD